MATHLSNYLALKKLFPGASFATVSVAVTANYAGGSALDSDTVEALDIQANPSNTGNIYICNTAANPDKVNWSNVLKILEPGASFPLVGRGTGLNTIPLDMIFIGADNATDFAIAYVRVA